MSDLTKLLWIFLTPFPPSPALLLLQNQKKRKPQGDLHARCIQGSPQLGSRFLEIFSGNNLIPSILVRVHLPPRSKQIVFMPLTWILLPPFCAHIGGSGSSARGEFVFTWELRKSAPKMRFGERTDYSASSFNLFLR